MGDVKGRIRVFRFPCPAEGSAFVEVEGGHTHNVPNVAWSADDANVFSVGGGDRIIMQWKRSGGDAGLAGAAACP